MSDQPIDLQATTPDEDAETYRREHQMLFGHVPLPDLATGQRCGHPMHDSVARLIGGPGVDVLVPFDGGDIIPDDDPRVVAFRRDYDARVHQYRDRIREIEAQERRQS